MGNTQSNILERLDDIASDYILGADFNTLKNMKDKQYCEKVTIVTKEILEKQFSHLDIEYLATRVDDGWNLGAMFSRSSPSPKDPKDDKIEYTANESVGFVRKIKNPNKPEMCLSISRFYVKIGHIFSAIVGTIKPRYKLSNGEYISILTPKKEIPKDAGVFELTANGFCYKRINLLRFENSQNPTAINPQFCNANTNYNSANDIQGVPEMEMLYYDETDNKGNPMMSDKNMSTYRKDLTAFYKRFTDEDTLPNDIHKFSDIQLKQYSASSKCVDNTYNKPIQPIGNEKENSLFEDYAINLREMIDVTGGLQQNLVEILNKIFTKKDGDEKITIRPNLTMATVDKLIIETRKKLLELYLRCEEYFENGVKIYKAIVNERLINNTYDDFVSAEPPPQVETEPNIGPDRFPGMEGPVSTEPVSQDGDAEAEPEVEEDEYVPADDENLYPVTENKYNEYTEVEQPPTPMGMEEPQTLPQQQPMEPEEEDMAYPPQPQPPIEQPIQPAMQPPQQQQVAPIQLVFQPAIQPAEQPQPMQQQMPQPIQPAEQPQPMQPAEQMQPVEQPPPQPMQQPMQPTPQRQMI